MRILILTPFYSPNVGGVETHLSDLTQWLGERSDIDIDVLTYQPLTTQARGAPYETEGRVSVTRISWIGGTLFHRFESKPFLQFSYLALRLLVAAIFHLLKHKKYDVIHAHGLAAIWVAGQLKRWWKIPVLGSLHTIYLFKPDSPTGRRIGKVLQSADHILSCSQEGVSQILAYGVKEDRTGRFTYWVNQRIFTPSPKNDGCLLNLLPPEKFICLFVGRLIHVKGVAIFLELARCHPNIFFLTVGDGPMEKECIKAHRQLPNFRHTGFVANEKLASIYSACDLLLVPSLFTEGIPRVICEALSCGLPVIASDRGGSKEALCDGIGILTDATLEAFSLAIKTWHKQGGTTESIRQACRNYAATNFGIRNVQAVEERLRFLGKLAS